MGTALYTDKLCAVDQAGAYRKTDEKLRPAWAPFVTRATLVSMLEL